MSTYVLIHGANHGGWCWNKIVPLIEREGHRVVTPELPGHGTDKTPISDISLQAYVQRVCRILDAQSEPVFLVGHSMSGIVITQAAEYRPEKVKKLVYVAAFLLKNMAEDLSYASIKEVALREVLYGSCSDEDIEFAKPRLVPVATAPYTTPVCTTDENFGRIPRVYISCLRDKAISPEIQEKMYKALLCEKVFSIDTDHSPFFSAPEELAEHLLSL